MIDIVLLVLVIGLIAAVAVLAHKYDKILNCLTNVSLRVHEAEDLANRVDESTGAELHRVLAELHKLQEAFAKYREEFGDAEIEEMKQAAEAQKAWADGLNNIMSFGADHYGRGDST